MLAWMSKYADKVKSGVEAERVGAGLLYRLGIAFPSWAGAIMAVYALLLYRFDAMKIRLTSH
jgi:hypothetical protein